MKPITPVILSGGSGSRLWPLSRELYPKQLLPLISQDKTLLQQTIERLQGLAELSEPVVVTNEQHRFLVAEQLKCSHIEGGTILLEPVGRNTAPAAALAAMQVALSDPESILLVLPADHQIPDIKALHQAIEEGRKQAEVGHLVTFGIVPVEAHTGYGYIHRGDPQGDKAFKVERFVEKPDAETAQKYIESGEYYWNSGMFMFRADVLLNELAHYAEPIFSACEQAFAGRKTDLDFIRIQKQDFAAVPADSIDYAVMEHTRQATVIPLDAGWNDVGSWKALWDIGEKDSHGNVVQGDVHAINVNSAYLHAESRMLGVIGLDNVVVVETADAVLVADVNQVQQVKQIVQYLRKNERDEALLHRKVARPWGSYECIVEGSRFKVKRIQVNPGASLSLQMHHHRAEHWIVVSGTARITRGEESLLLTENQSTYIPLGVRHRLENPGLTPLELIEVQSGSYLGEDDIVRFEDIYGRKGE